MQQTFDCHVHSSFSDDSTSPMAAFIEQMATEGLEAIGFSDHIEFIGACTNAGNFNLAAYKNSIADVKNGGKNVYCGAEIGWCSARAHAIRTFCESGGFDYLIGSVHNNCVHGILDDIRRLKPETVRRYYHEVELAIKSELFDVIGHIGYWRRYIDCYELPPHLESVTRECEERVAALAASHDIIVEINTAGLTNLKYSESQASAFFLQAFQSSGGTMACLSSDAHHPLMLGFAFDHVKLPDGLKLTAPWL